MSLFLDENMVDNNHLNMFTDSSGMVKGNYITGSTNAIVEALS